MRLLSWNINGIRTLPSYHPWNALKTCEAILKELKADIICFQEMKTSRTTLERHVALPEGFDSFFSFPISKGGYSGVAVYTDLQTAIPLKAEEGLSGNLQPKPPLSSEEKISLKYPHVDNVALVPDEQGNIPLSFTDLDKEGRALVVDFGLFVLINLYCPNEGSEARAPYKMNFHLMLGERVKQLISEGREVIVTGDINICASPIDHCDGQLASRANEFWEHPARAWLKNWLDPRGPMVDVIRGCFPDRQGMYTCWNTKISARESNYGTRIDYFLLTRGLLPWFKHGDVLQSLKGSDHCPIYIDLHDEIRTDSGKVLKLRDAMKMNDFHRQPPRLAAKFWTEFSAKQKLLSTFFGKQSNTVQRTLSDSSSSSQSSNVSPDVTLTKSFTAEVATVDAAVKTDLTIVAKPLNSTNDDMKLVLKPIGELPKPPEPSSSQLKRKKMQADSNYPAQPAKKSKKSSGNGQSKLSTFFAQSSNSISTEQSASDVIILDDIPDNIDTTFTNSALSNGNCNKERHSLERQMSEDYALALSLTEETGATPPKNGATKKDAWSNLFAPLEPPKCAVHGELAKEYKVNKPGPNKGKTFFLCSRPVGPGYDSGKSNRLREEVDPQYRCNFFKWSSEVKRASMRDKTKSPTS